MTVSEPSAAYLTDHPKEKTPVRKPCAYTHSFIQQTLCLLILFDIILSYFLQGTCHSLKFLSYFFCLLELHLLHHHYHHQMPPHEGETLPLCLSSRPGTQETPCEYLLSLQIRETKAMCSALDSKPTISAVAQCHEVI